MRSWVLFQLKLSAWSKETFGRTVYIAGCSAFLLQGLRQSRVKSWAVWPLAPGQPLCGGCLMLSWFQRRSARGSLSVALGSIFVLATSVGREVAVSELPGAAQRTTDVEFYTCCCFQPVFLMKICAYKQPVESNCVISLINHLSVTGLPTSLKKTHIPWISTVCLFFTISF